MSVPLDVAAILVGTSTVEDIAVVVLVVVVVVVVVVVDDVVDGRTGGLHVLELIILTWVGYLTVVVLGLVGLA